MGNAIVLPEASKKSIVEDLSRRLRQLMAWIVCLNSRLPIIAAQVSSDGLPLI